MKALALLLLVTGAGRLVGQDPQAVEEVRGELARLHNELLHSRDEVDRLLHLRLRHDLGLPVPEVAVPATGRPATTAGLEEARIELQREERVTAELARRYERLEERVQGLRAAAARAEPEPVPDWVAVPRPYTLPPPDSQPAAPAGETGPPGASRAGEETAPFPVEESGASDLLHLDPVRGQIQGSRNPAAVARALYRAAADLMATAERLRAAGRESSAAEFETMAAERLQRALDVLAPVADDEDASYQALFYQGKCREALFRIDERRGALTLRDHPVEYRRREQEVRDPFLAITVRDVTVEGGAEHLGRWGQAAQAALDHFRWMNRHAGFAPSRDPASITWGDR